MDEGEMKRGDFQFIGSEAWGKNSEILDYKKNKGSITVAVEMDKNTYLEEFLKRKYVYFVEIDFLSVTTVSSAGILAAIINVIYYVKSIVKAI
jgi:hypothetical protein